MVMLALAELIFQELGRDPDLTCRDAFLKFQLVTKGKIQAQKVFYVVSDRMIAVADDPADIPSYLQLPDHLHCIPDKGDGFHHMDHLSKGPAFQKSSNLLGLYIIALILGKDVLQLSFESECRGRSLDEATL